MAFRGAENRVEATAFLSDSKKSKAIFSSFLPSAAIGLCSESVSAAVFLFDL
jgi:hypothetical protein